MILENALVHSSFNFVISKNNAKSVKSVKFINNKLKNIINSKFNPEDITKMNIITPRIMSSFSSFGNTESAKLRKELKNIIAAKINPEDLNTIDILTLKIMSGGILTNTESVELKRINLKLNAEDNNKIINIRRKFNDIEMSSFSATDFKNMHENSIKNIIKAKLNYEDSTKAVSLLRSGVKSDDLTKILSKFDNNDQTNLMMYGNLLFYYDMIKK